MWYGCKNLVVWVNLFQLVKFVLLSMMDCLFSWFVYFLFAWRIVCNLLRIVQIVTCVKILYLEFFALGCVTVRFYYWENIVHWRLRYFWKFLFSLRSCIHLINKLHCNFAFSVETFGTVKNCVTWKLRYCEKLRYLETALLWKTALLGNCVALKNCVT